MGILKKMNIFRSRLKELKILPRIISARKKGELKEDLFCSMFNSKLV